MQTSRALVLLLLGALACVASAEPGREHVGMMRPRDSAKLAMGQVQPLDAAPVDGLRRLLATSSRPVPGRPPQRQPSWARKLLAAEATSTATDFRLW